MDWLTEPFALPFLRRAMTAGMVIGGLCALIGVFVVQRGLAFLGDGLAHAAFGGIALGLFAGTTVDASTFSYGLPFTILVALGICFVLRRGTLRGDVATGVFFSVSFALGVLFLGLRKSKTPVNVESLLFGNILAISPSHLETLIIVAGVTAIVLAATWSRLAYATFDRELATLSGVPVALLDYMLFALTAVVVVVAVKAVGIALVSSFVVIPAAAARMIGRTLTGVAFLAIVVGVLGALAGLIASYHLNVASGATIILTLGAVFLTAFASTFVFKRG